MSHDGLPLADCRANIYAVKFLQLKLFAQTLCPACSYIYLLKVNLNFKMHIKVRLPKSVLNAVHAVSKRCEVKGCVGSHLTVTSI